jgi:hypothetical protein
VSGETLVERWRSFGESAADAIEREFREALACELGDVPPVGV